MADKGKGNLFPLFVVKNTQIATVEVVNEVTRSHQVLLATVIDCNCRPRFSIV
jgi:hypothetical protein